MTTDASMPVPNSDTRTCWQPGEPEHDHAMCEDVVAEEAARGDRMITAVGEALEEIAMVRIGRDLGTIHRDEIAAAGAAAALRIMAEEIDRGPTFPLPPSVISELVRERAAGLDAMVARPSLTEGGADQ